MAEKAKRGESEPITVVDEPGMAERFQRGLQRALNTPPQHRPKRGPKPEEQRAPKGEIHPKSNSNCAGSR